MQSQIVKRAVVVALTYEREGATDALPCRKLDQEKISALLVDTLGFQRNEITLLTDYIGFDHAATWTKISTALGNALDDVHRSQNGRFFFYFAGHGTTVGDVEAICLENNEDVTTTQIEDVVNQFTNWDPEKHNLTWVFDSCHSGSVDRGIDRGVTRGAKVMKVSYRLPKEGTRHLFGGPQKRMLGDVADITVTFAACAKNERAYGYARTGFIFTDAFDAAVRTHHNSTNIDLYEECLRNLPDDDQHPQLITSRAWKDTQFLTPQQRRSIRTLESPYRDTYSRDTRYVRDAYRDLEPTSRCGSRDTTLQCSVISGRVFLSGRLEATRSFRTTSVEIGYLNSQYHPSVDRVVVVALGNGDVSTVKITRDGRIIQLGAASDPVVHLDGVSFAL